MVHNAFTLYPTYRKKLRAGVPGLQFYARLPRRCQECQAVQSFSAPIYERFTEKPADEYHGTAPHGR